jgi:endonuclease/exonuclease/phosphatase family metal-dependent hydrolase
MTTAAEVNANSSGNVPRPRKSGRLWKWILLLFFIAIAIALAGSMRWQTDSASGENANGPLAAIPADKSIFRIGTFNMHSGVGEDEIYNLNRTIESVRGVDFCGLNEVRGRLYGAPQNQAQELARATGCGWLYVPSERRFWHDDFGNGILTRLPIRHWVRMPLPTEPHHGGFRSAIILQTSFADKTVQVLVTHIDRDRDQTNQLRLITSLFDSLQQPALLLGDLNANSDNPGVKTLLGLPGIHDCISESAGQKRDRIDWILDRGLKTVGGGQIANGASDHPMYWVDVALAP